MSTPEKTRDELLAEITALRTRVAELEQAQANHKRVAEQLKVSERNYREIFNDSNEAIFVHDIATGRILDANRTTLEMFGYSYEEALSLQVEDVSLADPPYTQADAKRKIRKTVEEGPQTFEWLGKRKNGEVFWVEVNLKRAVIGGQERILAFVQDITERKEAEAALNEQLRLWRTALDATPDLVVLKDRDSAFRAVNAAFCQFVGRPEREIIGKTDFDLFPQDEAEFYRKGDLQVIRTGRPLLQDEEVTGGAGPRWLSVVKNPVLDEKGKCIGVLVAIRDVTDRKRAEEEIRRLAKFPSENPNPVLRVGGNGSVMYANDASRPLLDAWGCDVGGVLPDEWLQVVSDVLRNGTGRQAEVVYGDRVVSLTLAPVVDPGYVNVYGLDITDRKQSEETLREREARLKQIADTIEDVFWTTDWSSKRTVFASPAYERVWGRSLEDLYSNAEAWADAIHPDDRQRAWETFLHMEQEGSYNEEYRIIRPDGSTRWIRDRGFPVRDDRGEVYRAVGIAQDITERKQAEEERQRLEAQVQQAQKLESLGILAGGIAHDFNNLLTGILGNASLALMDLSENAPARPSIEQIEKSSLRAAELTNQMLAYSGRGSFVVVPVDLSKLIWEMMELLESSISKKVTVQHKLRDDLPAVEADVAQIRQVIMNLIVNASEAIGDGEGVITVATGVMDADRGFLAETYMGENLPEGRYVYLEVSDTGRGMDAETKSKIFDPFFTTKFAGRGLGLAATLGIVRGHRAAIKVDSRPARGSTFRVLFPCSDHPAEDLSAAATERKADPLESGTILVVDDEEAVRQVATRALERAGFTVVTASNGREAVEIFRTHADAIAAVLLDRTMPAMDGEEAFDEIRRIRPDAPVVLSSGYSEQEASEKFAGRGLSGFLRKPYQARSLVEKLREVARR